MKPKYGEASLSKSSDFIGRLQISPMEISITAGTVFPFNVVDQFGAAVPIYWRTMPDADYVMGRSRGRSVIGELWNIC